MEDPDLWTLYRSCLAVIRHGSLSAAARALSLSQPTLGRHIAELEQRLKGGPLFTRSPRGLLPTETALQMRPHIEAMESAALAAGRAASAPAGDISGIVRISASEIIGGEVLPGILSPLRDRHPGLIFELSLSNRTEDLLRRNADIAVRMVAPKQQALLARHIGQVGIGLYAHSNYADRHGLPATVADLAQHPIIGFDRDDPFQRGAAASLAIDRSMFALRSDNDLACLAAVRAGYGLGVIQHPIASRDPALCPVLCDEIGFTLDMWIVTHEDQKRIPRIRTTFDHLVQAMRVYAGLDVAR
jgi:DNA-binding transcriptional LysR family regulator